MNNTTPHPQEVKDFTDYIAKFYEEGKGIYADEFKPAVNRAELEASVALYITRCTVLSIEFSGDSIDRENVRDILEQAR